MEKEDVPFAGHTKRMRRTRKVTPDELPTYKAEYLSYVIEGLGFRQLIHIRDSLDMAKKDVAKYQHVGPTEITEKLTRVIYEATKTKPCVREV